MRWHGSICFQTVRGEGGLNRRDKGTISCKFSKTGYISLLLSLKNLKYCARFAISCDVVHIFFSTSARDSREAILERFTSLVVMTKRFKGHLEAVLMCPFLLVILINKKDVAHLLLHVFHEDLVFLAHSIARLSSLSHGVELELAYAR